MSETTKSSAIEVQHVNAIPVTERHGSARDLFPVWFSANLNVGNAFFGALAVIVGNNLFGFNGGPHAVAGVQRVDRRGQRR